MNNTPQWENDNFWADIDTVLLDMDGTLLDLHFDNYFWQTLLPKHYSLQNESSSSFNDLTEMYRDRKGTLDWYCVDFWSDTLNIDVMALKLQCRQLIQFRHMAPEFLQFLLDSNITPVLVTNAHRKSLSLKLEHCPLDKWITHLYSSHDFLLPKEHKNFWPKFINTYNFDKNKTVFIDDNDSVLKTAEQFGIKHLFSIEKPDSKKENNSSEFLMIQNFSDLIVTQ